MWRKVRPCMVVGTTSGSGRWSILWVWFDQGHARKCADLWRWKKGQKNRKDEMKGGQSEVGYIVRMRTVGWKFGRICWAYGKAAKQKVGCLPWQHCEWLLGACRLVECSWSCSEMVYRDCQARACSESKQKLLWWEEGGDRLKRLRVQSADVWL